MANRKLIGFIVIFKKGVTEKVATDTIKSFAPKLNFSTMNLGEGTKWSETLGFGECTKEKFEKLFGVKLSFTDKVRNASVGRPTTGRVWKTDPPLKAPDALAGIASRVEISPTRAVCAR